MHAKASSVQLSPPPAQLLQLMIQAAQARPTPTPTSTSLFEDTYAAVLASIDFSHEREVQFLHGDYASFLAVDFACSRRKIAIECDGSFHFLTDLHAAATPRHGPTNGRTKAKRRLLQQMGWTVISIPFLDNENLEQGLASMQRKRAYVIERMKEAGVTP